MIEEIIFLCNEKIEELEIAKETNLKLSRTFARLDNHLKVRRTEGEIFTKDSPDVIKLMEIGRKIGFGTKNQKETWATYDSAQIAYQNILNLINKTTMKKELDHLEGNWNDVLATMSTTKQTEKQTVIEHGEAVYEMTKKIIAGQWDEMKIPDWMLKYHTRIIVNLHPLDVIKKYNLFHDCGKPYCLIVDEDGKKHFPQHEKKSKEVFSYFHQNDNIVSNLIGSDMCLHVETADEILGHQWDIKTAMTLLLTSLAEIHANAQMFGGIESISFKMKWKKLNKRGKMLMKQFFPVEKSEHPYVYVIVRNDLSDAQKAVQGTHAAIELARNKLNSTQEHPSVIYVVVKNEKKLIKVAKELLDADINIFNFREPDIGSQMTAIITEPLIGGKREKLKRFQLL
jgi:hypothetical protein